MTDITDELSGAYFDLSSPESLIQAGRDWMHLLGMGDGKYSRGLSRRLLLTSCHASLVSIPMHIIVVAIATGAPDSAWDIMARDDADPELKSVVASAALSAVQRPHHALLPMIDYMLVKSGDGQTGATIERILRNAFADPECDEASEIAVDHHDRTWSALIQLVGWQQWAAGQRALPLHTLQVLEDVGMLTMDEAPVGTYAAKMATEGNLPGWAVSTAGEDIMREAARFFEE